MLTGVGAGASVGDDGRTVGRAPLSTGDKDMSRTQGDVDVEEHVDVKLKDPVMSMSKTRELVQSLGS